MTVINQLTRISAMDLRKGPGAYLDRVALRNEAFVIERAGRPRAVLVSVADYEQRELAKHQARERFWERTTQLRQELAATDPDEIQAAIDEAIEAVRQENRS